MSEGVGATTASIGARTPGAMLREARQAQGVHIAALAAAMKVSQRKLESLEADRLDELPDATFTRALAQSVCRSLKIDPAPVLALLPQHAAGHRLEHVSEGINEPFRDRPGRREPPDMAVLRSPMAWVVYLLVIASAVVYFLPQRWLSQWQLDSIGSAASAASAVAVIANPAGLPTGATPAPASTEPAASGAAAGATAEPASSPGGTVTDTVAMPAAGVTAPAASGAAPGPAAAAATPPAMAASGTPLLLVRATAASWIEVQDARSRVLLGRTVAAGESVSIDGVAPFRVKVGNAAGTELVFQGQPVNLASATRDNVARLELK